MAPNSNVFPYTHSPNLPLSTSSSIDTWHSQYLPFSKGMFYERRGRERRRGEEEGRGGGERKRKEEREGEDVDRIPKSPSLGS